MKQPNAVHKYDGRVVGFDLPKLARSLQAALTAAEPGTPAGLGAELARAAAEWLVRAGARTPSTADLRELAARLFHETGHARAAAAYTEQAENGASFLWRLRVNDDGAGSGQAWDRLRLLASFRASGLARDPAGEAAREVERRLVRLRLPCVSAALVHALALDVLRERALEIRFYSARRLGVPLAPQAVRHAPEADQEHPLPESGPALEAFWLQAVHSAEVAAAARKNLLGLQPYPASTAALPANRIGSDGAERTEVRADDDGRLAEAARFLAAWKTPENDRAPSEIWVRLRRGKVEEERGALRPRAGTVTLNVGGLLVRELARELPRAAAAVGRLVSLAAQAQREREEYWGRSAARGRVLPLALAGVWNAAAWLEGAPYERPPCSPALLSTATHLVLAAAAVVETLRAETGLELRMVNEAPPEAVAALWRRDRAFFAADGLCLTSESLYAGGLELRGMAGQDDLGERLDFLASLSRYFETAPAFRLEAPLGREENPEVWKELLRLLARSGLVRARLTAGGASRELAALTRSLRAHLEGYPLFEQAGYRK